MPCKYAGGTCLQVTKIAFQLTVTHFSCNADRIGAKIICYNFYHILSELLTASIAQQMLAIPKIKEIILHTLCQKQNKFEA